MMLLFCAVFGGAWLIYHATGLAIEWIDRRQERARATRAAQRRERDLDWLERLDEVKR